MISFGRLVEVEEPERLADLPEPSLVVLNHNNSLESVVVPSVLIWHRHGKVISFMVDWMFLHLPVVGWIMRLIDPIPVYTKPARWRVGEAYRRARRHHSPVAAAVARLESGGTVGIFPEGTRNRRPDRLLRARGGLAHLVLQSQAPVVPIGIEYPAATACGRVPVIGRSVIRIGEPLSFAAARDEARRTTDPTRQRALRHAVTDAVMSALAPLCGKEYRPLDPEASPDAAPDREDCHEAV